MDLKFWRRGLFTRSPARTWHATDPQGSSARWIVNLHSWGRGYSLQQETIQLVAKWTGLHDQADEGRLLL